MPLGAHAAAFRGADFFSPASGTDIYMDVPFVFVINTYVPRGAQLASLGVPTGGGGGGGGGKFIQGLKP